MAWKPFSSHLPRRLLAPTLVAIFVLSLLPQRFIGWASGFGDLARALVAPISHPLSALARSLRSGDPREQPPGPVEQDRDAALLELERVRSENADLRRILADLRAGQMIPSTSPLRLVAAPVVGRASDPSSSILTLRLRAGEHIAPNSVAVTEGVQLVGRVLRSFARTAVVCPITDRAAGEVEAVIILSHEHRLPCLLGPAPGRGVLRGPAAFPDGVEALSWPTIEPGMLVRLRDPTWPDVAQMLEVGRVESVEPSAQHPLRPVVTVRPRVDLARLSEVVLRVPVGESDDAGGEP